MRRLSFFFLALLLFDLIFLGPRGLVISNTVTTRYILVSIIFFTYILHTIKSQKVNLPVIIFSLVGLVALSPSVFLLPLVNEWDFVHVLADFQSILYFFIFIISISHLTIHDLSELKNLALRLLIIFSVLTIIFSGISNIFGDWTLSLWYRDALRIANATYDGIYIGPMPDGTFRFFLIGHIALLWALYMFLREEKVLLLLVILFACILTGTRALWISALIVVLSQNKNRFLSILLVSFVVFLLYDFITPRLYDISNIDEGNKRFDQAIALITELSRSFLFGSGFGMNLDYVRKYDAPYSYEFSTLALLVKIGLFGIVITVINIGTFLKFNARVPVSFLVAFALLISSNTYLQTIHFFTFLSIYLLYERKSMQ